MSQTVALDAYPEHGSASPGVCYRCKSPQRQDYRESDRSTRPERVVTLGLQIDFEGVLWLCESCVAEAARTIGMQYESEARATKADVSRHERRERAVKAAKDPAKDALVALQELVEAFRWDNE